VLGRPVLVPPPGEYVADGAARQAAWTLSRTTEPPKWLRARVQTYDGDVVRTVRDRYAEARDLTVARQSSLADLAP
jgi:xylulokinase